MAQATCAPEGPSSNPPTPSRSHISSSVPIEPLFYPLWHSLHFVSSWPLLCLLDDGLSAPWECRLHWNREVVCSRLNPRHLSRCLARSLLSIRLTKHQSNTWRNHGVSVLKKKGGHFHQHKYVSAFCRLQHYSIKSLCERKLIFDTEMLILIVRSRTVPSSFSSMRTGTCSGWPLIWSWQLEQQQSIQQNLTRWAFSWPSRAHVVGLSP